MAFDNYIDLLKQRGKRLTPGRIKILKLFCQNTTPLAADYLIKKTKLNKTSIYREIDFLREQEIINDVDFGDRIKRYELSALKHHHHLVCLKCGKVTEVVLKENLKAEEERIGKYMHFKILRHNLEFFGYCQNCIL